MEYIPHFSTLQKFASRVDMRMLECLMAMIAKRDAHGDAIVAVDSTGFSCVYASKYFIHTISVRRSGSPYCGSCGNKVVDLTEELSRQG